MSRLTVVAVAVGLACGQEAPPPPAPVPQEFDDPFAEEAKAEAKVEETKVEEAKVEETKVAVAEPVAPAEPAAVVAEAKAEAPVEAKGEKTEAVAATKADKGEKKASKKEAVPKDKSQDRPAPAEPTPAPAPAPVPADSPPAPAPVESAPAPAPAPVQPPAPVQNRFAGTYKFSGGDAQRQTVTDAIEAAVQELNALIRGIGRKRLTESNQIRDSITIAVDGSKVSMTFAPGRTLTCVLDGPAVDWTSDSGKPVKVKLTAVKGRLVHNYTADDGSRQSVYTLDESGDKLTLSVTVKSDRLTNPVKYALSYRRQ